MTPDKQPTLSPETLSWPKANDYAPADLDHAGNYGNTALMKAAREGNAAIVRELLAAGADIAARSVFQITILCCLIS